MAQQKDIQTKMVEESKKMVIDTKTRLDKAVEDLQTLIVRNGPCCNST